MCGDLRRHCGHRHHLHLLCRRWALGLQPYLLSNSASAAASSSPCAKAEIPPWNSTSNWSKLVLTSPTNGGGNRSTDQNWRRFSKTWPAASKVPNFSHLRFGRRKQFLFLDCQRLRAADAGVFGDGIHWNPLESPMSCCTWARTAASPFTYAKKSRFERRMKTAL